jgi:3-oxoacyl-[acyl-carrier protein] reductase
MGLLNDSVVLITGASKGIGKAISEIFASEGADIILVSRDVEALKVQADHLNAAFNVKTYIYYGDVKKPESLKEIFNDLSGKKIFIDVLVNNAGIMIDDTLQMVREEAIRDIFETNVYGTIYASQLAIKHFLRRRKGSVINLSSIIGTNGNSAQSIYGSSKAAVIGFTKSLSKELAPLNIRVNAIAPGFIDTDMTKGMNPVFYEKNLNSIGMKRIGKPEDVAKVALFLASNLSEYVTGQVIGVDGGMVI